MGGAVGRPDGRTDGRPGEWADAGGRADAGGSPGRDFFLTSATPSIGKGVNGTAPEFTRLERKGHRVGTLRAAGRAAGRADGRTDAGGRTEAGLVARAGFFFNIRHPFYRHRGQRNST